ncbi:hypothetical protein ASD10_06765 [Aeromicrobium sp. Root472D3]|nr:hypothetical protein ASD10_06765 [Aeromicrobium sp. Root472D3]
MTGTATSSGVSSGGPASVRRPGPIAPPDRPTSTPSTRPASAPAAAPSATRGTRPSRSPGSTRHPLTIPASSGTRPSTKTHPGNSPGVGSAASSGKPGTWPSWEPVRSTDVPEPIAKPGPTSADAVQSTSVGTASSEPIASAMPPPKPGSSRAHRSPACRTLVTSRTTTSTAAAASTVSRPGTAARTTVRASAGAVNHHRSPSWCRWTDPHAAPRPPTTKPVAADRTIDVCTSPTLVAAEAIAATAPNAPAEAAAKAASSSSGSATTHTAARATSAVHRTVPPSGSSPIETGPASMPEPSATSHVRIAVRASGPADRPDVPLATTTTTAATAHDTIAATIAVRKAGRR